MKKIIQTVLFLFLLNIPLYADEGMWLPQLLQQLNAAEMRLKGLQIPIDEIYNLKKGSLKDGVVQFGTGCSGEVISEQGLVLTNHHCGISYIQKNSTLEHNYLKDGFWAKTLQQEIPCPGLTVTFVVSIKDVTAEFNEVLTSEMNEQKRNELIKELSSQLAKSTIEGTNFEAKVHQFYSGNEFFIITTQTFKDIRLVGAPPSSIANFGGDTDNFMWPSYAGDFSMFRIYVDHDNKPSEYKQDNIPYKPKYFFPISLKGIQQDDFTMVYGFPGRTQEYISSYGVEFLQNTNDANKVMIREERLRIMNEAMRSNETINIQYAAKQHKIANYWKKWKGEIVGLKQTKAIQRKCDFETDFRSWTIREPSRKLKYGTILPDIDKLYSENKPYLSATDFYLEAILGVDVFDYANNFKKLMELANAVNPDMQMVSDEADKIIKGNESFFMNYSPITDQKMMAALLIVFDKNVVDSLKPKYFIDFRNKYSGDFTKIAAILFRRTIFVSQKKMDAVLTNFDLKKANKINKDPLYIFTNELLSFYQNSILIKTKDFTSAITRLNRIYFEGQREMQPEKKFYPDANYTLRLSYGQARGYSPNDSVNYLYQSTLDGLVEKIIIGNDEFDAPVKLVDLFKHKDYGRYGVNGKMPIAFIATNHTTGGNSGSPVLNSKGQLIGTNYDRVWDGIMSDVFYTPEICRNKTLDIRYTLFIIEKYAEAQRLIDEMDILIGD